MTCAVELINEMGPKLNTCLSCAEKLNQSAFLIGNLKLQELMEELNELMEIKAKLLSFA